MTTRGGNQLSANLRKLAGQIKRARSVRVGFLEGATYPDGTPVALVAAVQDMGAPSRGIPPRPFFRDMIRDRSPGWGRTLTSLLRNNNYDAQTALSLMGEGVKGQLQQSIVDFNGVPLKPQTVARKGFSKQLIDTSHLLNSADFEVKGT